MNRLRALVISTSFAACGTGTVGHDAGDEAGADVAPLDADAWAPDAPLDADGSGGAPRVELATGQSEVEHLSPADPAVELVYGAQGGYHVWGRAVFWGFAPDVDVWFEAVELQTGRALHMPAPGRRWIEGGVRRGLRVEPDGSYATEPDLVILNIRCTAEALGHRLRLTAHVRERATMREIADTRDVRVVDEVPSPACVPDA